MMGLALIVVLATGAQVIAALTGLPQIVPLLIAGVIGGPQVLGLFDSDELFGSLLDPVVTLAVGVVLFDGALQLRRGDLSAGLWRPVVRLVSVGVAVSAGMIAVSIHVLLGAGWQMSILCGAILTLSGPTVVAPLLHHIRPSRRVGAVLEWEGILIDPIGAIIAVIIFQLILGGVEGPGFLATVAVGAGCGLAAAAGAALLLKQRRVPLTTRITGTLALVLLAVAGADAIADDAGLVAAITAGVVVASRVQRLDGQERHEFESFGSPLVSLIIGILFVILSARVSLGEIWALGLGAVALVAALVLIQRPVAVALSTIGTDLTARERAFAAGLMPRGIVVASTASAFELPLEAAGVADAEILVPICFLVIASTVVIYGLGGRAWASALGETATTAAEVGVTGGEAGSAEAVRESAERDLSSPG